MVAEESEQLLGLVLKSACSHQRNSISRARSDMMNDVRRCEAEVECSTTWALARAAKARTATLFLMAQSIRASRILKRLIRLMISCLGVTLMLVSCMLRKGQ